MLNWMIRVGRMSGGAKADRHGIVSQSNEIYNSVTGEYWARPLRSHINARLDRYAHSWPLKLGSGLSAFGAVNIL